MKLALIVMSIVVAIAFVGTRRSPLAEGIDDALSSDRIVLMFGFQGDPEAVAGQIAILNSLRSRFVETVYVSYCSTSRDTWAGRELPVGELPTLFVITGRDSDRLVVRHRLESRLNAGMVEAVTPQVIDEG